MPVLIEKTDNGYRATIATPLTETSVGVTREEALHHLRDQLERRLENSSELVERLLQTDDGEGMTVGESPVWQKLRGSLENDPLYDEWQEAIRERRQQIDNDPDAW